MPATMLVERIGDLIVLVHSDKNPSDDEWSLYVSAVDAAQRSQPRLRAVLVTSLGGAPNAGQRKAIVDVAGQVTTYVTCVCTDSLVARGVITALKWLYSSPIHALPLHAVDQALDLLTVPNAQRPGVKALLQHLQTELGK